MTVQVVPEPASAGPRPDQALPTTAEVAVIGSGFSGLAMADRLRRDGVSDFVVLERGADVGGTWRDNSYPGCACDVPSHVYSFSFAPNPDWTSTFSPQAEIQRYLRRVAVERGLLPHVRFGAEVLSATWDPPAARWRVQTRRGTVRARVLIAAAGPLSDPSIPALPGLETFTGTVFHSATWRHDHDLAGERVAVVGTGASAIQFVPRIQRTVGRLHLYQRTPPWIVPRTARRLTAAEHHLYRRVPAAQRVMRAGISWGREVYAMPLVHPRLARVTRRLALAHLHRQVADPALRRLLTPDYLPGCKRILISNDYYPALTQPNVEVIPRGVVEVRERSVVDAAGGEREVDTIIFGTGFHVTDVPIAGRVEDGRGRTLADHWSEGGLSANRGTAVAGFPNFFIVLGPNTGLGHTSVVIMAEAQADYIAQALRHLRASGAGALEVTAEAQAAWTDSMQSAMHDTVWTAGGCASWYMDAHGRNTTLWPDYAFRFRRRLRRLDVASYRLHPVAAGAEQAA